jgi:hypothetical protein
MPAGDLFSPRSVLPGRVWSAYGSAGGGWLSSSVRGKDEAVAPISVESYLIPTSLSACICDSLIPTPSIYMHS